MSKRQVSMPYVAPGVTDPRAMKYQQEAAARAGKYTEPRGGGPTPPIPPLDQPHQANMTMADQGAMYQRQRAPSPLEGPVGHVTQTAGLLPVDVLPEEAKNDPEFQAGMGSMMAMSQPRLAYKYGVIRNGQKLAPQQLQSGRPGLSPDTIAGISQLVAAQKQPPAAPSTAQADAEAAQTSAGAAARLASESRSENIEPVSKEEKEKTLEKLDEFDWNTLRELMMKDLLNNEEQRQIIRSRCQPMDVAELVMNEFITQIVPVIPGKVEYTFGSTSADEELALKRLVMQEAKSLNLNDQYLLDKYSMMGAACGLIAVNGKPLPSHRDNKGDFSDELFLAKFNRFLRFPFHMIASIGVNYYWFSSDVRKLFQAEQVKNG